jgi:hypothetical protein
MNLLFKFINPKGKIAPCYTLKANLLWIHTTFQALSMKKQIDNGHSEIHLDFSIKTLHENLFTWLFESWKNGHIKLT